MGYAKRIDPYQDAGAVADWLAAQPGVKTGATSWFAMTTGGLAEDVAPALAARSKVVEAGEVVIAGGGVDGAAPPGAWSGELYGLRLERAMPRNGLELSAAYDIRLDSGLRAQGRAAARLRLRHWLGVAVMAEEGIVVLIMEARPGRPGAGTPSQVRLAPRADG
jgi:hypothetical protein